LFGFLLKKCLGEVGGKCTGLAVECTKVFQQTGAHKQVHLCIEMRILSGMCGKKKERGNSKENGGRAQSTHGKLLKCNVIQQILVMLRTTSFSDSNIVRSFY